MRTKQFADRGSLKSTAIVVLVLVASVYASFGPFIRLSANYFGDYAQIATRFAAAWMIVSILMRINGRNAPARELLGADWQTRRTVLLLIIAFPLSIVFFTLAVQRVQIGVSVFGLYSGSLTVTTLADLMSRRIRPTRLSIISLLVTIAGMGFLLGPELASEREPLISGILLAVAAGICEGLANYSRGEVQSSNHSQLLTYQFGFGVVLAAALSMSSGQSWFRQSPPLAILLGILYGAALVAIAFGLEWAFKRVSYQVGTQILSTEIVFAVILGSLLYSEVPNPASSIGGVLILCGALLAAFNTRSSENAFFKNL